MIGLPEAWAITTGSSNIIVAVVDNGIRFDHPALTGEPPERRLRFRLPVAPANFCGGGTTSNTGDGNGYDPDPTIPIDYDVRASGCLGPIASAGGHGIHTSGTIGAVGNDGVSVLGVNWHVGIRPVRVLGLSGGSDYDVAQGILYAAGPSGRKRSGRLRGDRSAGAGCPGHQREPRWRLHLREPIRHLDATCCTTRWWPPPIPVSPMAAP